MGQKGDAQAKSLEYAMAGTPSPPCDYGCENRTHCADTGATCEAWGKYAAKGYGWEKKSRWPSPPPYPEEEETA